MLYNDDCLKIMPTLPDKSIDAIICDLPYGTTASHWDSMIPFDKLWEQYNRLIKDNGAIVLFASGAFTYKVVNSNPKMYKYKWIWAKTRKTNFVNVKNRPMCSFEEILIFSKGDTANGCKNPMKYNPQGVVENIREVRDSPRRYGSVIHNVYKVPTTHLSEGSGYPCDILCFESVHTPVHPSQKPVKLLEYLVKTYTDEGGTVLDNCMGSGTTGIACKNTNRNFIGIELNKNYFDYAKEQIQSVEKVVPLTKWF